MPSPVLISTGIASLIGFLLNSTALYLVLSRGRKLYHYLFALILLICAIWNINVLLITLRNSFNAELIVYGYCGTLPCIILPTLIYHFTFAFTNRTRRWELYIVWGVTVYFILLTIAGKYGRIDGVYNYAWGNIFKFAPWTPGIFILFFVSWYGMIWLSCWYLFRAAKSTTSRIEGRHRTYVLAGFLAISFAALKVLVALGVDLPILMPAGMLLNDIFALLIAIAIVKDGFLDITVVIKKGALYSALAALIIFIFSFSEHVFATYMAEWIGGHSTLVHFLSIAVVIAVLMPFKHRLEKFVDGYFSRMKLEF